MFFGIILMFVLKDFVRDCFVAQVRAKMCLRAGIRAYLRNPMKQRRTKSFVTKIGTISGNMLTNFELKRLKPKLEVDIVEKAENRVHKLTDSNVSPAARLVQNSKYTSQPYLENGFNFKY